MNKLFTKIATAFVGIAMAIGVGVAVGGHSDFKVAEAATSSGYAEPGSGGKFAEAGWSNSGLGSKYADGSAKFDNDGDNIYKTNLFSGTVSTGMTQLVVSVQYKINGTGSSSNSITVTPYCNGSYGSGTTQTGFSSTSKTTKSVTISSGLAKCTGFRLTYGKSNGNLGAYKVSWTATYSDSKTLTSIVISGDMTTKSYTTAEEWSKAGLTVTGTYSDSTSDDLTSSATLTYYESTGTTVKATPSALGVGENQTIKIKATFDNVDSELFEITGITITKPTYTNSSSLEEGEYYIKSKNSPIMYCDGVLTSGHLGISSTKPGAAGKFTFTLVGNDTWSIINQNGQRLGINGTTTTSMAYGDGYTFKVYDTSTTGVYNIQSLQNTGRYIGYYAGNDFRSYNTGDKEIVLESTTVKYTVSYSGNNNTSGTAPDDSQYVENSTVTVATNSGNLAKTGYTFGGWNTNAAGTGTNYAAGTGTFTIIANITLHAKWNPTTYNITYSLDGGTHGTNHPSSGTYDTAFAVSAPTKEGYTFTGWTVTSGLNTSTAKWGTTSSPATAISSTSIKCINGANDVYFKNINAASTAVTLTATWTIITYNVFGTISHGSLTVPGQIEYGGTLDVTIEPDDGYGVPESSSDIEVENASFTYSDGVITLNNPSGEVTINASCVPLSTPCIVTYDANGGTVSPVSEQVVKNGHPSFPTPTWSGHKFLGWQVDGEGTAYTDPEDFAVTEDVEFVASWVAVYTVTFNSNGGSITPSSESVDDGSTFTFPSAGTKEHYSFDGWTSTGSTPYYAVGATSPAVTGNITYTAHWTVDAQYTVTYTAGTNGSGSFADTNQWSGSYTLKAFNALTGVSAASGYQFKNYTVGGVDKNPGDTITLSAATAVTVNFESLPTEATVTTNIATYASANSWANETKYSTINMDSNITVEANGDGNTGKYYTSGNQWRIYQSESPSIVFTAASGYVIKSITITYSPNSGGVLLDAGSNQISSGTEVSVNNLSSYTFGVGNTGTATNGQVRITEIEVVYDVSSTPVSTYTVTYNANGGSGDDIVDGPYNSGASVTVLDNSFSRDDYTFSKWNTEANGSGQDYEEGASFDISGNLTLYAQWTQGGGGSSTANRCYSLVTSAEGLVAGAKYIIVGTPSEEDAYYALSTTQNENNRGVEEITVSNNVASVTTTAVQVISLEAGSSSGQWAFNVGDGYLYAASSSKNYLRTQTTSNANGEWTISFGTGGAATVTAQGSNTHNLLKYNGTSGVFSAYSSGQRNVYFYRLDFGETLLANITCDGDGSHSMPTGYSWNTNLQGVYNDLPEAEKTALATASSAGLTRYDYIVGKYNPNKLTDASQTNYVHFITGRNVSAIGNGRIMIQLLSSQTTNTSLIVIVTVGVAGLAIGGYFLLRKKKEE